MKKLLILLLFPFYALAQTPKTDAALATQAQTIKNETVPAANTPLRVGAWMLDENASKVNSNQYAGISLSGTDTYTGTVTPAISSYPGFYSIKVKVSNTNTGPATVNLNSLGAKNIKKLSSGVLINLAAGDLVNNVPCWLIYNGTEFVLQLGSGSGGGGGGGTWGTISGTLPDQSDLQSALNAKQFILNPTSVKTTTYTAVAKDFIPVDATGGSVTIHLPNLTNSSFNGTIIGVKLIATGSGNSVTMDIAGGGAAVFNIAGQSTFTLSNRNSTAYFQFACTGIFCTNPTWYTVSENNGIINALVQGSNTLTQNLNFDGAYNVRWGDTSVPLGVFDVLAGNSGYTIFSKLNLIQPTAELFHSESGGTIADILLNSTGVHLTGGLGGGSPHTSIDLTGTSALFTDTRASLKGLEYAATGYVTQTHSLADKEYVDTHGVVTASQGLTVVGTDVRLGGTITSSSSILGSANSTLGILLYPGSVGGTSYSQFTFSPNGLQIDAGVTSSSKPLLVTKEDATTNSVAYIQRLVKTTTGTAAPGIGVGLEFQTENASGTTTIPGATIEAVSTNVTAGAETVDEVFKTMSGGSAASEKFRFSSFGGLGIGGANYGTAGQTIKSGAGAAAVSWADPLTLTTTGTSGAATYSVSTGTLNIPQYSGGGGGSWGSITGTLSSQTDLQSALDLKAPLYSTLNSQSGSSYTLVLTDVGKTVAMSNASSNTVTIPPNSSVNYPLYSVVTIVQTAGATTSTVLTTMVAGAGVTIDASAGVLTSPGKNSPMVIYQYATDSWKLWNGTPGLSGSAITKVDDANVLLTLGGSSTTALVNPATLTMGWTGSLSNVRGGTGTATQFTNGAVVYQSGSSYAQNATGFYFSGTDLGVGTNNPSTRLHVLKDDAVNNTVTKLLSLTHTTSGTAGVGIGNGIDFITETANGVNKTGMTLTSVATDVTTATEDFDMVLLNMAAGAAVTETFRVKSTGDLTTKISGTSYGIPPILKNSATLDFPSTATQTDSDLTITVTGALDGWPCDVGPPNGSVISGGMYSCWVSATNTVTVRFSVYSLLAKDPASGTFNVVVFKP